MDRGRTARVAPYDAEREFARLHARILTDRLIRDSTTVDFLRDVVQLDELLAARGPSEYTRIINQKALAPYIPDVFHRVEALFARTVHASPLIGAAGVAAVMTPQMRRWFDALVRPPWGTGPDSNTVRTLLAPARRTGMPPIDDSSRVWEFVCHLLEDELLASTVAPETTDAAARVYQTYQAVGARGFVDALATSKDVRLWFWHTFGLFYRIAIAKGTLGDERTAVVLGVIPRAQRDVMEDVLSLSPLRRMDAAWTPIGELVRDTIALTHTL